MTSGNLSCDFEKSHKIFQVARGVIVAGQLSTEIVFCPVRMAEKVRGYRFSPSFICFHLLTSANFF